MVSYWRVVRFKVALEAYRVKSVGKLFRGAAAETAKSQFSRSADAEHGVELPNPSRCPLDDGIVWKRLNTAYIFRHLVAP